MHTGGTIEKKLFILINQIKNSSALVTNLRQTHAKVHIFSKTPNFPISPIPNKTKVARPSTLRNPTLSERFHNRSERDVVTAVSVGGDSVRHKEVDLQLPPLSALHSPLHKGSLSHHFPLPPVVTLQCQTKTTINYGNNSNNHRHRHPSATRRRRTRNTRNTRDTRDTCDRRITRILRVLRTARHSRSRTLGNVRPIRKATQRRNTVSRRPRPFLSPILRLGSWPQPPLLIPFIL